MTPKGPNPHPDSPDNVPARRNEHKKNTAKEVKQVKDEKEEG